MIILNPAGKIINEEIEIKLQEDGRATYELELNGYSSGIYTALVKKGNTQSDEKFSVGLVTGSGPINAQVTSSEYIPGEKILLLGQTSSNVLLNVKLIDPNGVEIKRTEISRATLPALKNLISLLVIPLLNPIHSKSHHKLC